MAKVKKADLKRFSIIQVENGWEVTAADCQSWWDWDKDPRKDKTHVFTDLDELLEWIEANI